MITRKALAVARRRGWVLLAAAVLAAVAAFSINALQTAPWQATGVLVVPATQGSADDGFLGSPNEAARLAASYAVLLPLDDELVGAAAGAAGVSEERLSEGLTVTNLAGSSLIEVTIVEDSEEAAEKVLSAFIDATLEPSTPLITRGSLEIVRIDPPEVNEPISDAAVMIVGAILGALIGLIVVVFWERSDPRIDVPSDLYGAIPAPVSRQSEVIGHHAAAIAQRWLGIAGDEPVMVVGQGEGSRALADQVVSDIHEVRDFSRVWSKARLEDPQGIVSVDSYSDALLMAGAIVMVVSSGTRLTTLLSELRRLEVLGTPVDWIVFDG